MCGVLANNIMAVILAQSVQYSRIENRKSEAFEMWRYCKMLKIKQIERIKRMYSSIQTEGKKENFGAAYKLDLRRR